MDTNYQLLPELFLRAPFYSFAWYDLDRLPEVLGEEAFRNAIWLASPALYKVLQEKDFTFASLSEKERLTMYKYYNRMCFRPTPFGSFASFTLLKWEAGGTVRLAETERSILHLLPDLEWEMADRSRDGSHPTAGRLALNPTLYRFGREFRFVKSLPQENGRLKFSIDAIEAESLVIQLVARLKKKPMTATAFIDWLCSKCGSEQTAAGEYLEFLIIAQVLFPENVSGMIGPGQEQQSDFWARAKNTPVLQTGPLDRLSTELEWQPGGKKPKGPAQCFYAALERPHDSGGPGEAEKEELLAAVNVLQRLSAATAPAALQKFIGEFSARFDQEKVPLLLAADPDSGILYANIQGDIPDAGPLKDIRFPRNSRHPVQVDWSPAHRVLFRLLTDARRQDTFREIQLQPADLDEITSSKSNDGPSTQAVIFRKTAEYLLIEYAGGATATSIPGRFSLFSEEAANLCRKLAAMEMSANPGVVFADIDQRSDAHVDNINRRERIYPYFIPVNCYSNPADPACLPPGDLLLSVRNGELILESKRLRKRVIPRLSTAFNYYHNDLALFRLLCDLQYQGPAVVNGLDLERWFPGMDFYPRVVFRQTVLSAAKWKFSEKSIRELTEGEQESVLRRIRLFRQASGLPAKVSMGDFDQQLVFDLAEAQEAAFFLQCVKGLKSLTLQEYFSPARHVKSGNKPLSAQFVAFLAHGSKVYLPLHPARPTAKGPRAFMPGSEWLYLKLHCTPQSADRLLASLVFDFVQEQRNRIKRWFFIRYDENGYHLRIRFCAAATDLGVLLVAFRTMLVRNYDDKLVRDYQVDTYRRELERYGPELIDLAEEVFCAGSEMVCSSLADRCEAEDPFGELRRGIIAAGALIRCFLPAAAEQRSFTARMVSSFTAEFRGDKQLKIDLDLKYRMLKGKVAADGPGEETFGLEKLMQKATLLAAAAKDRRPSAMQRLLADIVHMQMNRNFQTSQRRQEFLLYYCLDKSVQSLIARERAQTIPPGPIC